MYKVSDDGDAEKIKYPAFLYKILIVKKLKHEKDSPIVIRYVNS